MLDDVIPAPKFVLFYFRRNNFRKNFKSPIDIPLYWNVYNKFREVIVMVLKIGELAKRVGVNPKTIRFYEDIGLITSTRAPNGYRIYNFQDESNLLFIRRAQKLGLSLQEIRSII
ncbi:MAG: MerR family transcriptional regulator, partial [Eubacteriales bacterium]